MSEEDYQKMLIYQGGRCAICGKLPGRTRLVRDHDHETGTIRGLLHQRCNRALGVFEWDESVIQRLILYLSNILKDRHAFRSSDGRDH